MHLLAALQPRIRLMAGEPGSLVGTTFVIAGFVHQEAR
jgi:hypothetical protein